MDAEINKNNRLEKFEHLFRVMSGERFLQKQGLGNEIPFFICPFAAEVTLDVEKNVRHLSSRLEKNGIQLLEVNLYDLAIEIIKERGIWEQILSVENTISKDELKELLQGVLDTEHHLVPAIAEKFAAKKFDILFLSGIGEVFPYIRSHNVLNNLQILAKDTPTVIFFPGLYEHTPEQGTSLNLFGRLHDDRYYRAFNIFHYEN